MKRSFTCAVKGIAQCIKSERNMRIHICVSFYVLVLSAIVQVSRLELVCIIICIALVTGSEMLNTAIEKLCGFVSPEHSEIIGRVKDISAGAVLIFAVISAAVGIIIFVREEKIARAVNFTCNNILLVLFIAATIPIAVFFALGRKKYDK